MDRNKLRVSLAMMVVMTVALVLLLASWGQAQKERGNPDGARGFNAQIRQNARELMKEGRHIFRFDTFGDEDF